MGGSEEYLAALGIDTSDVDKAVDKTITILGHLGNQFDSVSGKAEKAERALGGAGGGAKKLGDGIQSQSQSLRSASAVWDRQNKIYDDYLRHQERASEGANDATNNLSRLRYAVYDVSNAMSIGGIAASAFVGGILGANIAFEREFADVRRTVGVTGDEADRLYDKFIRISTDIPVAFSKLTEIGALAGQLGIVEDRVASFTETTAQFSATTDVSVEQSATAFGRLDTLIDGVDGRYKNLASSILNVGINSVATESQIIAIASQIAATGNQAGLTADEIIGLAGSLASLGVAPEAARGTILRVFSQINSAIAEGGTRLNDFATISNMSASDFKRGWSSDFTGTFLSFLEGVDKNGAGAETAIRSLGITATRDISALLKLSQNTEAVAANLNLAAMGFDNASILADNFGIIAETNASRLQVLVQTVQAFAATVGESTSGPLAGFLDYLQRILESLIQFSSTDFGQGVSFFATVLGAAMAVMLLLGAAGLRTAGSFLALKTAIGDTYLQTMLAQGGMRGFTATLFGAAGGANALGAALKATGVGLVISTGLYLLGEAVGFIGEQMKSGQVQAEEYFGSLDGLSEAIRADNAALFAAQLEKVNTTIANSSTEGANWVDALQVAAEAQAALKENTDAAGGSIDQQTLRIGSNTQEWLRNALASSSAFQEIFKNLDQLNALTGSDSFSAFGTTVDYVAFDLAEYVKIASTQGTSAANVFYDSWLQGLSDKFADAGSGNPLAASIEALGGTETTSAVYEAGEQIGNALTEGLAQAATGDAQSALLDAVLGPVEQGAEQASESFKTLVNDVYGLINAEAELAANTNKLGQDFATNGAAVASSGSAMQATIASIYASSSGAPEAAARMQGLFNALVQGGYASAAQLAPLQAIINSLAGGGAVKAAAFDMSSFANGITKVEQAAAGGGSGGAAKAVRTLVDYASDLRKVLSRAFEIRFGASQGADEIASGWLKIQDSIARTNVEIQKYQTEMQALSADRDIREYWLKVAENYGDALRAGQLRAEIAEIDDKLSGSAKKLADEQAKGSKTLVGNSAAAIANRAEILGLVGSYQDYIAQLASSGVSQAELEAKSAQLKAEFMAQATQLGYNSAELGVYASAFDDVTLAIQRLPRNITVSADVNPAMQALNELAAKVAAINGSGGINIPVRTTGFVDQGAKDALFTQWATKTQEQYGMSLAQNAAGWAEVRRLWELGAYGDPGFRKGGYTGNVPAWQAVGPVHGREFVLNQTGTSMFPRQVLDAANQGRQVSYGAPQAAKTKFPSSMIVELSPIDRELIASGARVTVVLEAEQVGAASSSAFSDDSRRGGS